MTGTCYSTTDCNSKGGSKSGNCLETIFIIPSTMRALPCIRFNFKETCYSVATALQHHYTQPCHPAISFPTHPNFTRLPHRGFDTLTFVPRPLSPKPQFLTRAGSKMFIDSIDVYIAAIPHRPRFPHRSSPPPHHRSVQPFSLPRHISFMDLILIVV